MTEENKTPEIVEGEFNDGTGPEVAALPKEKLRIAITGDNYLAIASENAFDPKIAEVIRYDTGNLAAMYEFKPAVVFVCDDVPLLKNESLDDANLIAMIQNVAQNTQGGVCLKTTINTETLERIIGVVGPEWSNGKLVYSPEFSENVEGVLTSDITYVGGAPKALDAYLGIIKHATYFSTKELVKGTVAEVIYAKLGVSGFKAVKQAYFNQLHQVVLDLEGANPTIVRRMIEKHPALTDRRLMVPAFIKAKSDPDSTVKLARSYMGEYGNKDVKMLVGQSDRITVLEEAINLRNLKED